MRAVVRIDHRRLWIIPHAACSEKVHAKLLLPWGETPLFRRAGSVKKFVRAPEQPISELQIIRITLVVVERMLELARDNATAVEHQIFANDPARIREAIGKLLVRGE